MATEKDWALVRFLTDATDNGGVKWEPTAIDAQYVAAFKGKYTVTIERTRTSGDYVYTMTLSNAADSRELLSLSDYGGQVGTLFSKAQRAALNVDAAIDEIMSGGEDIPF